MSRPVRAQGTAENALAETLRAYEHPEEPEGVASGYGRLAEALRGTPAADPPERAGDEQDASL